MRKEYDLRKSASSTAKANNLVESLFNTGIYFDFSLLDSTEISDEYKSVIKADFNKHQSYTWFEQPLQTIINLNGREWIVGETATNIYRIYRKNGKRMMVIVELRKFKLEKGYYPDFHSQMVVTDTWTGENYNRFDGDIEMEV